MAADEYKILTKVAEGRFGTVFAASRISTGERVAVKKIRARRPPSGMSYDPWSRSAERELEVLQKVQHEFVVVLLDHATAAGAELMTLVYEYMSFDLQVVIERRGPMFPESHAKVAARMMLTGLAYLHKCRVMHRDLKPANLLVAEPSGLLKIADFGSARFAPEEGTFGTGRKEIDPEVADGMSDDDEAEGLTREVCTRWYKSPEMLFGSANYTMAVDLWAAGCVLGDMLSLDGKALFPGVSDIDQFCCIFRYTGTVREDDWPEVVFCPDYGKIEFQPLGPSAFAFSAERSPEATEFLLQLLKLNPAQRRPAADALSAAFFCTSPLPAEPSEMVRDLGPAPSQGYDRLCSPPPMCGFDSGDSDLFSPGEEFEKINIETTTCGLWGDVPQVDPHTGEPLPVRAAAEAEARDGHSTPPPPAGGWQSVLTRRELG